MNMRHTGARGTKAHAGAGASEDEEASNCANGRESKAHYQRTLYIPHGIISTHTRAHVQVALEAVQCRHLIRCQLEIKYAGVLAHLKRCTHKFTWPSHTIACTHQRFIGTRLAQFPFERKTTPGLRLHCCVHLTLSLAYKQLNCICTRAGFVDLGMVTTPCCRLHRINTCRGLGTSII